jgi:hypothetical protein
METHGVIHNAFVVIVQDVGLYMGQEQLHALLSAIFNTSCWWINIVLTKDGICTLVNIVIANAMFVDLPRQSCTTQRFATSNAIQTKERNYRDQHPTNQFFPIAIKVFKCLHKHAYVLLHNWINIICNVQEPKDIPLSIYIFFFIKKFHLHYKRYKHLPS